jgi:hypothetical protein
MLDFALKMFPKTAFVFYQNDLAIRLYLKGFQTILRGKAKGCRIFLDTKYQIVKNIPNGQNIKLAIKHSILP